MMTYIDTVSFIFCRHHSAQMQLSKNLTGDPFSTISLMILFPYLEGEIESIFRDSVTAERSANTGWFKRPYLLKYYQYHSVLLFTTNVLELLIYWHSIHIVYVVSKHCQSICIGYMSFNYLTSLLEAAISHTECDP